MSEWQAEFGSPAPQGVGDLMREVVDGHMASRMTDTQRAAAAWYRANGDREHNHTTGVFLKRPRFAGAPPILCVYVDSHAMVTDFGVNKDIYLARLANVGYEVSGIEFLPSRKEYRTPRPTRDKQQAPREELPSLTQDEQQTIDELVASLPDDLRPSVSKAVSLSVRRNKLEKAQTKNSAE